MTGVIVNEFIDYAYDWLDKVLSVTENGQQIASFNYHNDGQIAQAIHNGKSEDFLWDGLALIHRGENSFINEPYVTGGNPILSSKDGVMFNDMLGSTLNIGGKAVNMTSFGESTDTNAMYTSKPYIGDLGYAFLFRNYRSDYGKRQTTDPLGYPDGWNNLAYCGNKFTFCVDFLGMQKVVVLPQASGSATLNNLETYIIGYWEANKGDYVLVYAENMNSAKQQLNELSAKSAITGLIFTGHGTSSIQNIGSSNNLPNDSLTPVNVQSFYSNIKFANTATILYEGCYTANSIGKANLAQMTANVTGCETTAMLKDTVYSKNYYPFWLNVYYSRELGSPKKFTKLGE